MGAAIYIAASGVSLADWVNNHGGTKDFIKLIHQYGDQTIAAGILSLFVAVVFFVDVILTFRLV